MDEAALLSETVRLLRESAKIAQHGRGTFQVEVKGDTSLVTNIDREIESLLKPELLKLTPGAGFWGEEYGHSPATDAGYWVVDPIDGTSNFAYHQPLWGITIGFVRNGKILLGAFNLPDLNEEYTAISGQGALLNGQPMPMIPPGPITPTQVVGHGDSDLQLMGRAPGKVRHIGAFVVEAAFVATQRYRAMTTGRVSLYDAAAGILVCRELGAEVRHWDGRHFDESKNLTDERCEPMVICPANSNFPFGSDLASLS